MILVTGGLGFIGSVLIKELNKLGREDILLVDRFGEDTKWKNILGLKFDQYIHADDFLNLDSAMLSTQITSIYHMGACSSTTETNVDYLIKNNFDFSKKIFDLATLNNIPFAYASSAATYGNGEKGYSDQHDSVSSLRPMNPYGFSKQLFDQWVVGRKRYPKQWYGLKFFNVYGPNEYHKSGQFSVVYKAFLEIKNDKKAKLFKSYKADCSHGEQRRDFVYVKDVVRAMIELMNKNATSGIYNLGTGEARSFNDLVKSLFSSLGMLENIEYVEMPENLRQHYQYFTQANMEKFTQTLPGFKFTSLEDGINDYVKNYLLNADPYIGKD